MLKKAPPSKKLFKYYLNPTPIPKIKSYENGITIIETILIVITIIFKDVLNHVISHLETVQRMEFLKIVYI